MADFSAERWELTMEYLLDSIHEAMPRRKSDIAWRLGLVARYHTTLILREEAASFMEWSDLATLFGWPNGPSFSAHCRRKLTIAFDDSGLQAANVLASLRATISQDTVGIS